jgi:hypothetical protein
MTFANKYRGLSILAILLAAVFCACSSVGGNKLPRLTSAPVDPPGAVVLQADGGAPPPPILPRPQKTV